MARPALIIVVAALVVSGCGDDGRRVVTDTGADAADATTDAPADGATDAMADAPLDTGAADAGPMCTEILITPFEGRPCPMSMRDCVDACADTACVDGCLAMAAGDCRVCINRALVSCVNRNGCQELWNCQSECLSTNCPMDPSDACVLMHCREEDDAYFACIDEALPVCGTRYVDCLAE